MKFKICNVEFDVDFTEADVVEAFEDGNKRFAAVVTDTKNRDNIADYIRCVVEAASDWLDDVLGDGASEKIFNGRCSLRMATEAARDFTAAFRNDMAEYKELAEEVSASAKPQSRQERRAQERVNRKRQRRKGGGNESEA